ncbi:MAG: Asp-tRNA(Asn)/Glu-tRNA(Gln) amidotransferase subunit GatA [Cyclobacteriaceae bacterium]
MSQSYLTLSQLRKDLLNHKTSCTDRVRFHLDIISRKKHLNAFLSVFDQEALAAAAAVDQKIAEGKAGKLAGLVVGIKDVFSFKDHPLQASSKILKGFVAQYNATVIQRLLDEDAIIIGRQNCDEFAMGSSNENSAFGPVLNELDNERVSGGSSGGSAVAVMADMCQVSIGSDTGGSVRQPAAFCGVVGLKPTYGRISRHGLSAYGSSFDCVGILSKSIEDAATVLQVIAGSDEFDSTVSSLPVPNYARSLETVDNNKYKIAFLKETLNSDSLQPEIKQVLEEKITSLRSQGHHVEIVDFPLMDYLLPTYYILATAEASSNLSRYDGVRYGYRSDHAPDILSVYKRSRTEGFGEEVKRRILLGTFVLSANYYDAYYNKAQKVRRLIRDQTRALFKNYDFVMMPTTPTTAFKINQHQDDPVAMYLADLFSVHANVAGIPAISIPAGKNNQGLPIGIQVMAADFEESKLFQFSNSLVNFDKSSATR